MSSWFISPWEAARFSLEVHRRMALLFFPFAPRTEQKHLEVASDAKSPFISNSQSAHSADVAIPPRPLKSAQARTVAARNTTEVVRKGTGSRKRKKGKGKRKNGERRG
jgi:hypothetical protein